jgi:hypothetical protein
VKLTTLNVCRTTRHRTDYQSSLEQIALDYIERHRPNAVRELRYYQIQPSLEKAIEIATLAKMPSGKRHPHQRRIPASTLVKAKDRLLEARTDLQTCHSFEELINIVNREISPIKGIGRLTVYDTAHRLGAFLGLEPQKVYLHAGTRDGARALGLDHRQEAIEPEDLPLPWQSLKPYEVEDCLCMYKHILKSGSAA